MTTAPLTAATERAYRANIPRFYLYRLADGFQLWVPIWVVYLQQQRGLSLAQVTLLDGPFWVAMVLAEVPTGAIADHWGRKQSLLLGALSYTVAIFIFGISTTFWLLLGSYLVWAVAMTLQSGADTAFLYDTLAELGREREFRKVFGRGQAINVAAGFAGGLIGAPLAAATTLATPILISSAISLTTVTIVLGFTEPRRRQSEARGSYLQVMHEAGTLLVKRPALRSMIVLRGVLMGAGMTGFIFTQPFLSSFDVPVASFGVLLLPIRLASIVAALVVYRFVAPLGERRLLVLLTAGFAGAWLALGIFDTVYVFAMFALIAFCNAAATPLASDYISRHSPQHLRATMMSVSQMAVSLVLLLAEPGMGALADATSLQTAFLLAGTLVAVLGGAALLAWIAADRRAGRAEETPLAAGVS
jgi:MFS family permease